MDADRAVSERRIPWIPGDAAAIYWFNQEKRRIDAEVAEFGEVVARRIGIEKDEVVEADHLAKVWVVKKKGS